MSMASPVSMRSDSLRSNSLRSDSLLDPSVTRNQDSAFPAMVPGVPVKSVYERAGFEVNKNQLERPPSQASSGRSIRSKPRSPFMPNMPLNPAAIDSMSLPSPRSPLVPSSASWRGLPTPPATDKREYFSKPDQPSQLNAGFSFESPSQKPRKPSDVDPVTNSFSNFNGNYNNYNSTKTSINSFKLDSSPSKPFDSTSLSSPTMGLRIQTRFSDDLGTHAIDTSTEPVNDTYSGPNTSATNSFDLSAQSGHSSSNSSSGDMSDLSRNSSRAETPLSPQFIAGSGHKIPPRSSLRSSRSASTSSRSHPSQRSNAASFSSTASSFHESMFQSLPEEDIEEGLEQGLQQNPNSFERDHPAAYTDASAPSIPTISSRHSKKASKSAKTKVCRGCGDEIVGKSVSSRDGRVSGKWHRHCFTCTGCQQPFDGEFYALNDLPYCELCYHHENNSVCQCCGNGIEGECLETSAAPVTRNTSYIGTNSMDFTSLQPSGDFEIKRYHAHCLTCSECSAAIADTEYYIVNGATLCAMHAFTFRDGDAGATSVIEKRSTRLFMM